MRLRELLATCKGRVQGVGFRAKVKSFAENLQLTGFVRNLQSGDVEICAQGEQAQLEQLCAELKRAFPDLIHHIECDFRDPSQPYSDFRIIPG